MPAYLPDEPAARSKRTVAFHVTSLGWRAALKALQAEAERLAVESPRRPGEDSDR